MEHKRCPSDHQAAPQGVAGGGCGMGSFPASVPQQRSGKGRRAAREDVGLGVVLTQTPLGLAPRGPVTSGKEQTWY